MQYQLPTRRNLGMHEVTSHQQFMGEDLLYSSLGFWAFLNVERNKSFLEFLFRNLD